MKFDIKKNFALHSDQTISFIDVLAVIPMRINLLIIEHWKIHRLRRAIQSERKILAKLSDRELEDIGISRFDAIAESQKRYNDLPINRCK